MRILGVVVIIGVLTYAAHIIYVLKIVSAVASEQRAAAWKWGKAGFLILGSAFLIQIAVSIVFRLLATYRPPSLEASIRALAAIVLGHAALFCFGKEHRLLRGYWREMRKDLRSNHEHKEIAGDDAASSRSVGTGDAETKARG